MSFLNRLFLAIVVMAGVWVSFLDVDANETVYGLQTIAIILLVLNAISTIGWAWLFALYKFVNYPLRKHYESREQNYKDVISKLEQQLYTKNGKQPEAQEGGKYAPGTFRLGDRVFVGASGTNWYQEHIVDIQESQDEL